MPFRGKPLVEHAIAAAARWQPVVVAGAEVAEYLRGRADLTVVQNDEPELGMTHSLALANRAVARDGAILVLLGDKPLADTALVETIAGAAEDGDDVVYPVRNGEPGHPVALSPRARDRIGALPPGDTLRRLRADPELRCRAVETAEEGAFFDVDTLGALRESEGKR